MGYLNKCMLIGNLCAEPEMRQVGDSTVLNISLAVNESYKDKNGQKQDKTEFIRLVMWNHPANIVHKYCRKGSKIFAEGKMQTREWADKNGEKRFTTEVNVRNIQLLDAKSSDNQRNKQGSEHYQQRNAHQNQEYNQQDDYVEDGIPF